MAGGRCEQHGLIRVVARTALSDGRMSRVSLPYTQTRTVTPRRLPLGTRWLRAGELPAGAGLRRQRLAGAHALVGALLAEIGGGMRTERRRAGVDNLNAQTPSTRRWSCLRRLERLGCERAVVGFVAQRRTRSAAMSATDWMFSRVYDWKCWLHTNETTPMATNRGHGGDQGERDGDARCVFHAVTSGTRRVWSGSNDLPFLSRPARPVPVGGAVDLI